MELGGGRVKVKILTSEKPELYVNELTWVANESKSPIFRVLDAERLDDEAITLVVNELVNQVKLDKEELVRIMEFLKKDLATITRVDIDSVLTMLQERTMRRDPSIQYRYNPATTTMFTNMVKDKKTIVSATTQGVIESGLSWATRIQNRWDKMGITRKEDDPIGEMIIVTDPKLNDKNIDRYLTSRSLNKYVDIRNVIYANTPETNTVDYVEEQIQRRPNLAKVPIGIRANEGELAVRGEPESLLLQLKRDDRSGLFVNINMYEVLFDLLSNNGEMRPILGLEQIRKNVFMYLPPIVPRDYKTEMENYNRTVQFIRTAA
jgi:hypothetical protein